MKKSPLRRKSKNSRKLAHLKAWSAFSLWVILSNADSNGNVKCFTCGIVKYYKEIQAGHWIHGDNMDFIEENVNPQCVYCNLYLSGNERVYTLKMIKLYGMEMIEELERKHREPKKYGIQDFRDIEEKYKNKVMELNI